jgi:hypothetical protein
MDEQEIAYAIGWLLVASGVLAVVLSSNLQSARVQSQAIAVAAYKSKGA